jgi:purine nucleosidase/pyrimidine-specific ribonucleoside hydrolase
VLGVPTGAPIELGAPDAIAEWIRASDGPVTLVPVGPLTNIARLIETRHDVIDRIDRIVVMGGSIGGGNISPVAEFNIWADPEAAAVVFGSGLDVTMIGLDVTHRALLSENDEAVLREAGHVGAFVADLLEFFRSRYAEQFGSPIAPIHDAAAVAHLIDPGLITTEYRNVEIELTSELTRGCTVVDMLSVTGRPANAHVGVDVDGARFAELLVGRLLARWSSE